MEDAVDAVQLEVVHREIESLDVEPARVLLFERDVVVVREAVDAGDVVTLRAQPLRQVRPDKPGRPRHHELHSVRTNGFSVPSPFSVRLRSEKNRVITIPSRKSPSLGSGRSPRASASASSG